MNGPPVSHAELRALFEHLDRTSMTGYECDHTFVLSAHIHAEHATTSSATSSAHPHDSVNPAPP